MVSTTANSSLSLALFTIYSIFISKNLGMPTPTFLVCPDVVKFENVGQIAVVNGMVYLGGSVGIDKSGTLHKTLEEQTRQTFDNIRKCLEYANSGLDCIVSLNIFLSTSLSDSEEARFNELYREVFCTPATRPCRCCVRAQLQEGLLVEVVNVVAAQK